MDYIHTIFGTLVLGLLCLSCGSEDHLLPSGLDKNYFEAPGDATDAESVLRREFFTKNGSYLIFNDTLHRELKGTDEEGNPLYTYELLDIGYGMTSISSNRYAYDYLKTIDEKKIAVTFLENRIMPVITEALRPYSVLATQLVKESVQKYGEWTTSNIDFYWGMRTLAIALSGIENMTEEQQAVLADRIVEGIVRQKVNALGNNYLTEFYKPGENYYEVSRSKFPSISDVKIIGFLSSPTYTFPKKSVDLEAYLNAFFSQTEEEFMLENKDYPVVQEKYRALKEAIKKIGFNVVR